MTAISRCSFHADPACRRSSALATRRVERRLGRWQRRCLPAPRMGERERVWAPHCPWPAWRLQRWNTATRGLDPRRDEAEPGSTGDVAGCPGDPRAGRCCFTCTPAAARALRIPEGVAPCDRSRRMSTAKARLRTAGPGGRKGTRFGRPRRSGAVHALCVRPNGCALCIADRASIRHAALVIAQPLPTHRVTNAQVRDHVGAGIASEHRIFGPESRRQAAPIRTNTGRQGECRDRRPAAGF